MSREEMIEELMEGVAFEEDCQIERALRRYAAMSDEQIKLEFAEVSNG